MPAPGHCSGMQREPGAERAEHSQRCRQRTQPHSPAGPLGLKAPQLKLNAGPAPQSQAYGVPRRTICRAPPHPREMRQELEQLIRQHKQQLKGTSRKPLTSPTVSGGRLHNCPIVQRRKLRSVHGINAYPVPNSLSGRASLFLLLLISNFSQVGGDGGQGYSSLQALVKSFPRSQGLKTWKNEICLRNHVVAWMHWSFSLRGKRMLRKGFRGHLLLSLNQLFQAPSRYLAASRHL